jgi:hypothetical protein
MAQVPGETQGNCNGPNITIDKFSPHGGQPTQNAATSSYGYRRTFLKSLDSANLTLVRGLREGFRVAEDKHNDVIW